MFETPTDPKKAIRDDFKKDLNDLKAKLNGYLSRLEEEKDAPTKSPQTAMSDAKKAIDGIAKCFQ